MTMNTRTRNISQPKAKVTGWLGKLTLAYLLAGLSAPALAGTAASGQWYLDSARTQQGGVTVNGSSITVYYKTPQGDTGSAVITRNRSAGYNGWAVFVGNTGVEIRNIGIDQGLDGPPQIVADNFNYTVTTNPDDPSKKSVIEVVQSPYSNGNTGGNNEAAIITLDRTATVVKNSNVDLHYKSSGGVIIGSGTGGAGLTFAGTGNYNSTNITSTPQLRTLPSTGYLYYRTWEACAPTCTIKNAMSQEGATSALSVGSTGAAGNKFQLYPVFNADSNYKLESINTSTLTLDYTANEYGSINWDALKSVSGNTYYNFSNAATTADQPTLKVRTSTATQPDPLGETFTEWIAFGIRTPKVTLIKKVNPASDPTRFDLQINGNKVASSIGDGGTGSLSGIAVGSTVNIGEYLAGTTTLPSNFDTTLSCTQTDSFGTTSAFTVTPTSGNQAASFTMPSNDVTCTLTNAARVPQLTIKKDNGVTSVTSGGQTTYTLTVTNTGSAPTSGALTIRELLGSGLTFASATSTTGTVSGGTTGSTGEQVLTFTPTTPIPVGGTATLSVTANVTASSGSVVNKATVGGGGASAAPDPASCTTATTTCAVDTDTLALAVTTTPPSPYTSTYPAQCDVINWSTGSVSGSGSKTIKSADGLDITANLTPATGTNNGIPGWSSTFTSYGSWYEVRAVSTSLSPGSAPSYGGAFVTRAGNGTSTNTITITFPYPVINVRFGVTDLDAIDAGNPSQTADMGDWLRATATYSTTNFNPDVLIADGHALTVKGYNTTGTPGTASAGSNMNILLAGTGNTTMGAGGAAQGLNTLMGTDTVYGTGVDDPTTGTVEAIRRQGQGVVYFKGPLTTLTIVTGSKKANSGQAIALSNIDFCAPSIAVDKKVGTPVSKADGSFDIPYTLTFKNTTFNQGLYADGGVRDATFSASTSTPSGYDSWADIKPQLSDNVVPQILANTNVASATVVGSPKITVTNTVSTKNLDGSDTNTAFDGNANPTLISSTTDGRVSAGGSFDASFTVNTVLKDGVTTAQTVNNTASASGTLNTTTALMANSPTVTATLSPQPAKLTITKAVDKNYIKVSPDPANIGTATLSDAQVSPVQLVYTLTVKNTGTTSAYGVVVTDVLPNGLSFVSANSAADGSGTSYTDTDTSAQGLSFDIGTLTPGTSQTIYIKTKVNLASNTAQSALLNTAATESTNASPATSNQVRTDVFYPKLTKEVRNVTRGTAFGTKADGLPGDVLEYCLNYMNYSSVALAGYSITDHVPGNTAALTTPYSGQAAIMLVRTTPGTPTATTTTTYLSAATDTDNGSLSTMGGTYGQGTLITNLGSLAPGETGKACFRVSIR